MASTEAKAGAWLVGRLTVSASPPSIIATAGVARVKQGFPGQRAVLPCVVYQHVPTPDTYVTGPSRITTRMLYAVKVVARGTEAPEDLDAAVDWIDSRLQAPVGGFPSGNVREAHRTEEFNYFKEEYGVMYLHRGAYYALMTTPG